MVGHDGQTGVAMKKRIVGWLVAGSFVLLLLVGTVWNNPASDDGTDKLVTSEGQHGKGIGEVRRAVELSGSIEDSKVVDRILAAQSPRITLDERQTELVDGTVKRELLLQVEGKYAYRYVEEIIGKDVASRKFAPLVRTEMVADQILVHLRDGISLDTLENIGQQYGATIERILFDERTVVVKLEAPTLDAVAEAVEFFGQATAAVAYAEPDYIRRFSKTPNDTQYGELWGMTKISAPAAWDITTGNKLTLVAVIDTGMDMDHPDLISNLWNNEDEIPGDNIDNDGNGYVDDVNGWDFVDEDKNPEDADGHGTHCAGTVAATGDNANQVAGVCWSASIMPIRVGTSQGLADSDIVDGIRYAARNGAKVLSNSYGGSGFSQTTYEAIAYANNLGAIFVAAAGNGGSDGIGDNNDLFPQYPASYELPNIIAVAATDQDDNRAVFSNFGALSVDLAAPGVNIVSTYLNGATSSLDGTSMACPHVAGALALFASTDPGINPAEAKQLLLQSVDLLPDLTGKVVSGGRLNLQRLLAEGTDADGDGMPDSWEEKYGFLPDDASNGGTNDFDGDFLTNVEEFQNGCNPTNSDTDADSLVDGWEIRYGFNALDSHNALPKLQYLGANNAPNDAYDVAVEGGFAYVADGVNGLRVFNLETPSAPQLIATLATSGSAHGVTLAGDKAYVSDSVTGLHIIDISTPALPVILGSVEMTAYNCAVEGNYAYVAAGASMLQVVSVANPSSPSIVGVFNNNYRIVNDVAVSGNYVYLAMDGYVARLNISNPTTPSGYLGYAVYGDVGKSNLGSIFCNESHVFLTQDGYGFSVYDLNLSLVSRTQSLGDALGIHEFDDLIFLADGSKGLTVFDGSDLQNIVEYDSYENVLARSVVFIDGHTYVAGRNSGLHVFRTSADLDEDGMYDKWERDNFGSLAEDWNGDFDADGINNWGEYLTGLDPISADQDGDGLIDGFDEVQKYNTDPRYSDTDGDGLSDYDEVVTHHTDPYKVDTDEDGLTDYEEVLIYGTDPLEGDADGDGIPEGWELKYGLDPNVADGDAQLDDDNNDGLINGDDLSNLEEYLLGSDPTKGDTDADGFFDKEERDQGTNPVNIGDPLVVDDNHPSDPVWWDPILSNPTNEIGTRAFPFDSLQEAINVASNNVKIMVMAGEYDGALNRNIDTKGKILTIEGVEGASNTTIYADGLGSGFVFKSGETTNTVIKGFTITTAIGSCEDGSCGNQHAILCQDVSSPLIVDCVITNNELSGIECKFGSSPVIKNCDISSSSKGINCSDGSSPVILNSRIHNVGIGVASVGSFGLRVEESEVTNCWNRGVWVKNDAALSIKRSEINGNNGGLRAENCLVNIDQSKFLENIAPDYYEIEGVTFYSSENKALESADTDGWEDVTDDNENGAAILLLSGSVMYAQNVLIADNDAVAADPEFPENKNWPDYGLGGGIYVGENCWVSNMNCTVANNTARRGAGISSHGSHADHLRNLILWGNSAEDMWIESVDYSTTNTVISGITGDITNYTVTIETTNYNVQATSINNDLASLQCRFGDGFDVEYCDVEHGGEYISQRQWVINTNPLFVAVGDYHLSSNSPCVDVGTITLAPIDDLDGVPRGLDGNNDGNLALLVDLGAYESIHAKADTDDDTILDINEITNGTDPTESDTDNDGMSDGFEVLYGLDALGNDSAEDADSDGVSNLAEAGNGTDPTNEDTDGDNSPDGDEDVAGTNPIDPMSYFYVSDIQPLFGGGCEVTFDTVAGRIYTVYVCADIGGEWIVLENGIFGTGAPITVQDPLNDVQGFYQVEVSR